MRTYQIELRASFEDEEKYETLLEIVRQAAREMLATAMILKDKRDPQIALNTGDMFETNKDLSIVSPGEEGGE